MMPATVYLIIPLTDVAREWLDENLDPDAQRLGKGIAVEHRYIEDILLGMVAAGLCRDMDYEIVT